MTARPRAGNGYRDGYEHIRAELQWLDCVIADRVERMHQAYQALNGQGRPQQGFITDDEVRKLLREDSLPTEAPKASGTWQLEANRRLNEIAKKLSALEARSQSSRLFTLTRLFSLTAFDAKALIVCLAPELRRKYDKLYAYLQDDITRQRPSVDLILDLLCQNENEKWQARARFAGGATLIRCGILRRVEDPGSPSGSSGLAQFLTVEPRIVQYLLGHDEVDEGIKNIVARYQPAADDVIVTSQPIDRAVAVLGYCAKQQTRRLYPVMLVIREKESWWAQATAYAVARRIGCHLFVADCRAIVEAQGRESCSLIRALVRECILSRACLYFSNTHEIVRQHGVETLRRALSACDTFLGLIFLDMKDANCDVRQLSPLTVHEIEACGSDVGSRTVLWMSALAATEGSSVELGTTIADRVRIEAADMPAIIVEAEVRRGDRGQRRDLCSDDIFWAIRNRQRSAPSPAVQLVTPRYDWTDLVLSNDRIAHLKEICEQVRSQPKVFRDWGFGRKLAHGRGLSVLFTGAPGTGKSMAAQVIAQDLGLHLHKIDLSRVVSKYIGETEKNLSQVFDDSDSSESVLFFDEADSLFGKRTVVKDAHDRYANIETSYLLQKIEDHEGVVILATNFRENIDSAFLRRIRFIVDFPFPDEATRKRIWTSHLPTEAPASPTIDFDLLARELKVTGGVIRNIVLNAAFNAAAEGSDIELKHILHGARRELEKVGKPWTGLGVVVKANGSSQHRTSLGVATAQEASAHG